MNNALVKDDGYDLIKNNDNTNVENLNTYIVAGNILTVDNTILDTYKTSDYEIVVDGGFSWCSMEYIDFNISDADKTIYME